MLSVKCQSCGGTNIFDETKYVPTYCSFCGNHFPDLTFYVQESLRLGINKAELELDKQRHAMEIETIEKQTKRQKAVKDIPIRKFIIGILMFILIVWLMIKRH